MIILATDNELSALQKSCERTECDYCIFNIFNAEKGCFYANWTRNDCSSIDNEPGCNIKKFCLGDQYD